MAVPALIPDTSPDVALIVATPELLDDQVADAEAVSPLATPFTYFSFSADAVVVPPTVIE